MKKFKAKLKKQGNSYCIYVPKSVRTELDLNAEYEWFVRTETDSVYTEGSRGMAGDMVDIEEPNPEEPKKISPEFFNTAMCPKHSGSRKGTCGCK